MPGIVKFLVNKDFRDVVAESQKYNDPVMLIKQDAIFLGCMEGWNACYADGLDPSKRRPRLVARAASEIAGGDDFCIEMHPLVFKQVMDSDQKALYVEFAPDRVDFIWALN